MSKEDPHLAIQDCYLDRPYDLAGRIIDPITGNVSWQGQSVHLQRKHLEVLALLASAGGNIVSRANFIALVWDGNDYIGDRGISDKIFSLRRALDDHNAEQPLIRTIPRRGYQLTVAAVQPVAAALPVFSAGAVIPGCAGWRLQRQLSATEESESWLARADEESSPLRVFSFCRSEPQLQRFRRETTLLRYLIETLGERSDIALIHDWQLEEPPYFLARDYCTYGSLNEWAEAVGGLATQTIEQREAMMLALATAVAGVHAVGLVHGQLSPQSILVDMVAAEDSGDEKARIKLSGFDLGALTDRNLLAPFKITAAGLSFVDGNEAPKTTDDIYALGSLLLQLALGDLAVAPNAESLQRITDLNRRALIAACFAPHAQRPSIAALVRGLGDTDHTETSQSAPPANAKAAPIRAGAAATEETMGPYRLFEKLGEGGMGTVYLAEQREPVQRQVALKVILAGMDTNEVLARFEAERQALALMNHVNVAAVFDAGSNASGRPYFAMEYVPGAEITAHCDQRQLDFRSRIELFLQVCDGVLHAHQKGIIHRDLKPSNILIKSAQGQPATPKIIDFGVAKSLQRKLGNLTAHTELGSFVGTRTYSSPEQINGNVAALDTRTDTYSLGVVLYELLAGVTPYDEKRLAAKSPVELSRLISSEEPPTLLKRFVSLDATLEIEIALRRKLTVAQMKQTLNSDLAWIVAKCLERDPSARYASVLELKKDLCRWMENRPVEARPITWTYRARKMLLRNRAAVALGSIVALALVAMTVIALVSYTRAEQARIEAELVADFQVNQIKAIDPASMGLKLSEILLAALKQTDSPEDAAPNNASAASRLASLNMTDVALKQLDALYFEPALAAIESNFAESPLLQARLKQTLAVTLRQMGLYQQAATVVESSLALRTKLLGSQDPLTLESLRERSNIKVGLGLYAQAQADLSKVLAETRAQFGSQHPQTIKALQALGNLLLTSGNDKDAVTVLSEALRSSQAVFGDTDSITLNTMTFLAEATFRQGKLDEAEKLARMALAGFRTSSDTRNWNSLSALSTLTAIVAERGDTKLAESYGSELVQNAERLLGTQHQFTLAARASLAETLVHSNRVAEGIALHREVLNSLREAFGIDYPDTLRSQIALGGSLRLSGQFEEAAQLLQDALEKSKNNSDDSNTSTAIFNLGLLAKDQGKLDEAERLLNESVVGARSVSGEADRDTKAALKALEELKEIRRARGVQ